jgi:hypothetical protein
MWMENSTKQISFWENDFNKKKGKRHLSPLQNIAYVAERDQITARVSNLKWSQSVWLLQILTWEFITKNSDQALEKIIYCHGDLFFASTEPWPSTLHRADIQYTWNEEMIE